MNTWTPWPNARRCDVCVSVGMHTGFVATVATRSSIHNVYVYILNVWINKNALWKHARAICYRYHFFLLPAIPPHTCTSTDTHSLAGMSVKWAKLNWPLKWLLITHHPTRSTWTCALTIDSSRSAKQTDERTNDRVSVRTNEWIERINKQEMIDSSKLHAVC